MAGKVVAAVSGARIVVLVSGSGSNLQALLDAPDLGGEVVLVASDRPAAGGLDRARGAGIPAAAVPRDGHPDRVAWEQALTDIVAGAGPDLVVLAGFMRILSAAFVTRWPILNVHPALLPAFPGAHGVRDALAWGVKVTGATVHYVDEHVDHGPIVLQAAVDVRDDDDEATLHARIQSVEHRLLPQAVGLHCAGRIRVDGRITRILPP